MNLFVAGFIGSPPMNFLPASVEDTTLSLPHGDIELTSDMAGKVAGHDLLIAGVRPEHFEDAALLGDERKREGLVFRAEVDVIEWLGSEQYAYIPFEAPHAPVRPRVGREPDARPGRRRPHPRPGLTPRRTTRRCGLRSLSRR